MDLTIRGRNFGPSREGVDGQVRVAGIRATNVLRWTDSEIQIVVPFNAPANDDGLVEVTTLGQTARINLRVSC